MSEPLFILIAITPALCYLCWSEWKFRLLPNRWTVTMMVVALILRLIFGGWRMMADGAIAGFLGGFILLIPFMMGAAGGGDLKMLTGVCCALGTRRLLAMLFLMSWIGLILAIGLMCTKVMDHRYLKHYFLCLFWWKYDRKEGRKSLPKRWRRDAWAPFGLAIAGGAWLTLILDVILGGLPL
jgi:Flp pilus assembly protein protease CpaA